MTSNSVYNKLLQFKATEINLSQFQDLLESSSRNNKIRVEWETLEGNTDYYWMWWDSGAYVGGEAGGSETKQKEMRECLILKQLLILKQVNQYGEHYLYKLYQKQDFKINYIN